MSLRLEWPMRLAGGQLATVEQDSDDDITQCIRAILMHRPGDRADLPEMGVADWAFSEQPLDLSTAQEILRRHEPRVDILLAQDPQSVEQLVAEVQAQWGRRGGTDA